METLEHIISSIDSMLNTDRKRHIMGGILLSASLLFSGFAITVMTIKHDENDLQFKGDDFYEFD